MARSARGRRLWLGALTAAVLVLGLLEARDPAAAADEIRVEIDRAQRVTIAGRSESLRAVLQELCWRGGASLRYDAPDHAFASEIEDVPLEKALARLLRGKNHVVSVRATSAGESRVTSVTVFGPEGDGTRTLRGFADDPVPSTTPFNVPLRVLDAVFATDDPDRRQGAIDALARSVLEDPDRRNAFLASDPEVMANALRRYPEAPAILRQMIELPGLDPAARAQLGALLAAVE